MGFKMTEIKFMDEEKIRKNAPSAESEKFSAKYGYVLAMKEIYDMVEETKKNQLLFSSHNLLSDINRYIGERIRSKIVHDLDPNEDFNCGFCGKELFTRILYCSKECTDKDEEAQTNRSAEIQKASSMASVDEERA